MNSKQKQFSDEMNLLRIGVDYWKVRPETATSDGAALRARAMALPEPSPVARSTLDGMLSQDSRVRRRFRSESICYAYEDTPADVSIASGFYIDALMKTDAKDIVWKWNLRATTLDVSLRKEISEEAFRSREKMDIHWRYLCHLNRLNDYAPALKDMTEVDDQARYWLKPKTRTYAYGPGFELKFAETLPKLVPLHSVSTGLSYRAFVLNRTLWAKTGSTLLHTATVHTHLAGPDGIESNMVTTKWLTAWTLSDDELWTVATNNSRALSKMIQKREAGKVRAVISGDFVNYLRMSYISYAVLDEMFAGWNVSPIFMNTTQQNVMWDDIATFDGVRMPIDQSSFDQMQSKDTVMSVFKFLVGILFTHVSGAAVTDLQRVGMQLLASIEAGVVRLSTDEMLPWMNGLLSGWRWTALIGTLISLVTFNMAVGLAREYMDVAVSKAYFQGDDIAAEFGTTNSAAAVYLCFLSFGLEVNPMKFIISNTMHDEFLRRSIRPTIITGYPARSVLGILWHNPINDEEEIKAGVLASTFDRWWLFKDRLGIPVESLPFMADMCRATGLSRRDVTAWLSTPSTYGGGGYKVKPKGSGLGFYEPVTDGRFSAEGMVGVKAMEAMFPADWASFAKTTLGLDLGGEYLVESNEHSGMLIGLEKQVQYLTHRLYLGAETDGTPMSITCRGI